MDMSDDDYYQKPQSELSLQQQTVVSDITLSIALDDDEDDDDLETDEDDDAFLPFPSRGSQSSMSGDELDALMAPAPTTPVAPPPLRKGLSNPSASRMNVSFWDDPDKEEKHESP
eukprot:CAMPEP_0172517360 /NCGR_PEP_ID=MMETSP1066-20121228/284552_1 /TAXON_ID=671091 /ORGANISM="Coscinodiscus wailesii, Strain CCMP2513" /LENGTH=114 /DNA_ID=CAMNT_0013299333 /DNA_START=61 /DNA_END=402 /DNA_ORIENTATION=+